MLKPLFSVLVLALVGLAPGTADPWLHDYEAALKAAASSGKPVLVDITGSDWCIPCQRMENEVFSRLDFLPEAQGKYILLRLDYPKKSPQPEKLRVQNQRLEEKYPFDGFPTYLLLDSQGLLYGKHTGLVPGGVKAFFAMTSAMEPQKATLAALTGALAKASPGIDRAKAQDALFRQAETWNLESQYGDLPLKIIQEDKDGTGGLKPRYQVYNAYNRFLATWADLPDFRQAIANLEQLAARATPWPDLGQKILFTEGMVQLNALKNELEAKEAFRRVRILIPDSALSLRASELLDTLP